MNNVHERFEALAQRTEQLQQQTRMVEQRPRWGRLLWGVAALGLALLAVPRLVQAKIFHCSAGDVPCLIAAINAANANGETNTIRLKAGTYTLTAVDNDLNGLPVITSTLAITGRGAETTIIERDPSAPPFRVLAVAATGTLTLKRLTLRGGGGGTFPSTFAGAGAGINNSGTLTLSHCVLTDNRVFGRPPDGGGGGGISNSGTLTLSHCLLTDNRILGAGEDGGGGGLRNEPGGLVTIAHTTFAQNFDGDGGGGGIRNRGTVIIAHTTFIGNGADHGGGLKNEDGGTMILTHATVAQNSALSHGGGIWSIGNLEITNSTVSHNSADFGGGGLSIGGTMVILNATIAENTSGFGIGGISGSGAILQNTILARNSNDLSEESDCAGVVTSFGNNLIGDPTGCTITLQPSDLTGDPGLGPFTDNGRPGNGHFPLLPTSQAIAAGSDAVCPRTDQLGRPRIGPCDIGAIRFLEKDDRHHEEEDDQHDVDPAAAAQAAQ
jgi:hypothetical protein